MKKTLLLSTLFLFSLPVHAEPKDKMDAKQAEMQKLFMEASKTGEQHQLLKQLAGEWKYSSKWWDAADSKPQESKGSSSIRMIFGGRFLQQEVKGKFMGQAFNGMGITGFDNVKGKFVSTWFDNMSTAMMQSEGTLDASNNTIKEAGTHSCPISKGKTRKFRTEWQIVSKDKHIYRMFGPGMDNDDEYQHMELVFTRAGRSRTQAKR